MCGLGSWLRSIKRVITGAYCVASFSRLVSFYEDWISQLSFSQLFFLSQTVVVHGWKKKKKSAEELKLGLWPFRGAVAALPEVMVGFFACVSWAKREEQMVPLRSSCRHKRENDDSMTLAYRWRPRFSSGRPSTSISLPGRELVVKLVGSCKSAPIPYRPAETKSRSTKPKAHSHFLVFWLLEKKFIYFWMIWFGAKNKETSGEKRSSNALYVDFSFDRMPGAAGGPERKKSFRPSCKIIILLFFGRWNQNPPPSPPIKVESFGDPPIVGGNRPVPSALICIRYTFCSCCHMFFFPPSTINNNKSRQRGLTRCLHPP